MQARSSRSTIFALALTTARMREIIWWQIEPNRQLLHPLHDLLIEHYELTTDYSLICLTERGTNHITVLHLNRPELVEYRYLQAERQREQEEYLSLLELFRTQGAELEIVTRRLKELSSSL